MLASHCSSRYQATSSSLGSSMASLSNWLTGGCLLLIATTVLSGDVSGQFTANTGSSKNFRLTALQSAPLHSSKQDRHSRDVIGTDRLVRSGGLASVADDSGPKRQKRHVYQTDEASDYVIENEGHEPKVNQGCLSGCLILTSGIRPDVDRCLEQFCGAWLQSRQRRDQTGQSRSRGWKFAPAVKRWGSRVCMETHCRQHQGDAQSYVQCGMMNCG